LLGMSTAACCAAWQQTAPPPPSCLPRCTPSPAACWWTLQRKPG
jgi:hypothetical protein